MRDVGKEVLDDDDKNDGQRDRRRRRRRGDGGSKRLRPVATNPPNPPIFSNTRM